MNNITKRNGNIELLRFIFCLIIVFYHTSDKFFSKYTDIPSGINFFRFGFIGVEFFFLVSGYFMAKSADKSFDISLAQNTYSFMKRKVSSILPYHLIAFCVIVTQYYCYKGLQPNAGFESFLKTLPTLFFLKETGIEANTVLGMEWYISAMLIVMFIVYPLIVKYGEGFKLLFCPAAAVLFLGVLSHETKRLDVTSQFVFGGLIPKTLVRAFAEICFGSFIYEAVKKLKSSSLSNGKRTALTVAEAACYIIVFIYSTTEHPHFLDYYAFYTLAAGAAITFSEQSFFAKRFNNKAVFFLGKWSLPIYLCQNFGFYFIYNPLRLVSDAAKVFIELGITFAFSLLTMLVVSKLRQQREIRKK